MAASQNAFCSYKLSFHKKNKSMQIMTKILQFLFILFFYHWEIVKLDHFMTLSLSYANTVLWRSRFKIHRFVAVPSALLVIYPMKSRFFQRICGLFWPGLTGPVVDRRTCEPVSWPPEAAVAASWGPCGWAQSWPSRGCRSSGTWSSRAFQSCHILIIFSSSAIDLFFRSCLMRSYTVHCKKLFIVFPVPSRDVTNQTFLDRE